MRISVCIAFALLFPCLPQPLAAAEFEVIAAIGVREPGDLQAGQKLAQGTRLALESWGRVMVRETSQCGLTQIAGGVDEYVLELTEDCKAFAEPIEVATQVQSGAVFSARLETGGDQALGLIQALASETCAFMPRFSEESAGRSRCPSGYALRGMRCSGNFCDDKDTMCCPYLDGAPDDTVKSTSSRWISEEFPNTMSSKKFINGLDCRGPYCDDILPQPFKSSRLINDKGCEWTAWTSEQPGAWQDCGPGRFVAGFRCRDQYCGDVGLYCCQARVE